MLLCLRSLSKSAVSLRESNFAARRKLGNGEDKERKSSNCAAPSRHKWAASAPFKVAARSRVDAGPKPETKRGLPDD